MTPSPTATAAAHAPIEVAGRSFATKAALGRYVRALMARYPDAVPLEGDDERFVRSLLDRHPRRKQKLGAGVAWVEVRSVASPVRSRGLWLVRPDGSSAAISWRSCVTPPAYRRAVLAALRTAVQGQVLMFRVKEFAGDRALVCPLTGMPSGGRRTPTGDGRCGVRCWRRNIGGSAYRSRGRRKSIPCWRV